MGCDHQVVSLDHQVVNRRARQIELQALPVSSAIEGRKHTGLGGRIQQVASGRILAHHVNECALREAAANWRPGLASVAGPEDVGLEVIELVTVDRDIRGVGVVTRRLDHAHRAPRRHLGRRHVGPAAAVVAGEVDQPVVGSDPDHSPRERRLGDGEDRVVVLDARDVLGDGTAGRLLLGFVVAGEIGADGRPAAAVIGRLVQALHAVIERVPIEGRHDER